MPIGGELDYLDDGTITVDDVAMAYRDEKGKVKIQQTADATAGKGAIERLARQFGANYVIEEETASGQYLVAHTSAIFLVDPLGRMVATFSQPHYAPTLLSQHRKITAYFSGSG